MCLCHSTLKGLEPLEGRKGPPLWLPRSPAGKRRLVQPASKASRNCDLQATGAGGVALPRREPTCMRIISSKHPVQNYFLALKAEALHLADRTAEALDAIREGGSAGRRIRRAVVVCRAVPASRRVSDGCGCGRNQIESVIFRSHQDRKGSEVDFTGGTRRSHLHGITSPKSERVRRTWIPTPSLLNGSERPHTAEVNWVGVSACCGVPGGSTGRSPRGRIRGCLLRSFGCSL